MPKRIPLIPAVPSSGLYVQVLNCGVNYGVYGVNYGDDDRLARLLRETWQRIPFGPRRRMVAHWKPHRIKTEGRPRLKCPTVNIANIANIAMSISSGRPEEECSGYPRAVTKEQGRSIQFDAQYFAAISDAAAIGLIAHELGHVYLHAIKSEYATLTPGESHEMMDQVVDEITCEWGFRGFIDEMHTYESVKYTPSA